MTNVCTVTKGVQKPEWCAVSWWAEFEANAIACPLVQVLEGSKLACVSATIGLQPPAHISDVQTSFFFISAVSRYCQPGSLLPREPVSSFLCQQLFMKISGLPGLGSQLSAQVTPLGTHPR